jgi:hypothetical protein
MRNLDATDLDRVESMEFLEIVQVCKSFPYVSLTVTIRWHMRGGGGNYLSVHKYSVVLKSVEREYKLTEFNPKS